MTPQILFFIIKLVLGGIVGFLAILVLSKTRDISWVFLVTGFLLSYVALVYELMAELGVISLAWPYIFGIPLPDLLCHVVPNIAFILAFAFKLTRK